MARSQYPETLTFDLLILKHNADADWHASNRTVWSESDRYEDNALLLRLSGQLQPAAADSDAIGL